MRMKPVSGVLVVMLAGVAAAQDRVAIENRLTSEFRLTQPTADLMDVVTAGSVLVIKRGNIVMTPVFTSSPSGNTYKEGKMTQNVFGKIARFGVTPGVPQPNTRTFVPGEKVWVTKIECKDDGVVFTLFTDAYYDMRYKATVKFPFDKKGAMPTAEQMDRLVGEVFRVDDGGQQQGGGQQQERQAPARQRSAPPPQALAPIAPPPPPPDEPVGPPKELKLGMTKDQVVGNFGQPQRVVKLGTKEILYYPDLKVTLVSGKVTDVQ